MARDAKKMWLVVGFFLPVWFVVEIGGCARSMPPTIPEFKMPAEPDVVEKAKPQLAVVTGEPEAPEPEPEPKSEPKKPETKPAEEAPPAPAPEPEPEVAGPTIIGSWRVTGMTRNGESMPGLDQMTMIFTFHEDGRLTMDVSSAQMPESQSREGSWSISDGQISLTMENETKTGSYSFDGPDNLTFTIDEGTFSMTRT